jgi:hypothetical protein
VRSADARTAPTAERCKQVTLFGRAFGLVNNSGQSAIHASTGSLLQVVAMKNGNWLSVVTGAVASHST